MRIRSIRNNITLCYSPKKNKQKKGSTGLMGGWIARPSSFLPKIFSEVLCDDSFQMSFGYGWEDEGRYFPRRPKRISAGCVVVFLRRLIKELSGDHGGMMADFLRAFGRISGRYPVLFPVFLFRNSLVFKDFPSVSLN